MDTIVLELGGKSFKLVFGLKLLRLLGRKWELEDVDQVVQKLAVLDSVSKIPTFLQLDVLEVLLVSAIECSGQTINLFEFDILNEFMKDPSALDRLKDVLIASLPQQKPEENKGK
jgi:hypothetical protein